MCTKQPTVLLYYEKIAPTSDFFPMNTLEFMDQRSILLVTLLAISFDEKFLTKLKIYPKIKKNLTRGRIERKDVLFY